MGRLDLIVRGGAVVTPGGTTVADVAVVDGVVVEIAPELEGDARATVDARGLHVFPGVVDAHVHLNDPGRADWEGFATGTAALAAGGATTFADMPLNASPPTLDGASFDAKVAAAVGTAHVDFALWGGLVPGPLDRLDELAARGVIGFKAFMCSSGIDDFPAADDETLRDGMARAAELGLPVAVHAESDALTASLAALAVGEGRTSLRDYLHSRPVAAELEAVDRALELARETGCSLHIVHLSSGQAVRHVHAMRRTGADVTCETCPHYLALDEEDAVRLGAVAKCSPPLRPREEVEDLWHTLIDGEVDLIGSDHSPSPPDLKRSDNAFEAWGGIAGGQTLLRVMLTEGLPRGLSLAEIARLTSVAPASRFRLRGKGSLETGADADLAVVDLGAEGRVEAAELLSRHRLSPFVGRKLRGRVALTVVRGCIVCRDGVMVAPPGGRLVRPASGASTEARS